MSTLSTRVIFISLAVFLAVLPLSGIYLVLIMKIMCYAIFACAFNLLLGFGGLMSFGHAMFFGLGAYVGGYVQSNFRLPVEASLLAAIFASAILGVVVGLLTIKRQGIYFSMITLAFCQMVYFGLLQAPFTGGENGLQGIPRGKTLWLIDLDSDFVLYFYVAAVLLFTLMFVFRVTTSPFGQLLRATKDNSARVVSLGYSTERIRLKVIVLSAAVAGLAGGLKAVVFGVASLGDAHWHLSGEVVLMTLLGGIGTYAGPVIGAALTILLQSSLLDRLGSLITVVLGVMFVACVMFFRDGVVGFAQRSIQRVGRIGTV